MNHANFYTELEELADDTYTDLLDAREDLERIANSNGVLRGFRV